MTAVVVSDDFKTCTSENFHCKTLLSCSHLCHQCWCSFICLPEEKFVSDTTICSVKNYINTVGIHLEPYTPLYTSCKQTNNLHVCKQTHNDTDMTCRYLIDKLPACLLLALPYFYSAARLLLLKSKMWMSSTTGFNSVGLWVTVYWKIWMQIICYQ